MANERLFELLANALSQPSKTYQAATSALDIPKQAIEGYKYGADFGDSLRKRKLEQQTLSEALGGQPLEEGIMNFTGESGAIQHPNAALLVALQKAKREGRGRASQLFGTQGSNAMVYQPSDEGPGSISTIPLPNTGSDAPILPKAVTPTLSPLADPSTGQPLTFTPGRGLSPTGSTGGSGGVPVTKQGNAEAVKDVSMMQAQSGNIDKLFDSYKLKGRLAKGAQATPLGSVFDPETKQLENSLKLTAFTIAGKNFTENEKPVVFGALFPGPFDNDASNDLKRNLLKGLFSGKIDLYQAANLLGPSGETLRGLIQNKLNTTSESSIGDPEAEAAIARVQSSNISENEKKARISGIRAAAGQR